MVLFPRIQIFNNILTVHILDTTPLHKCSNGAYDSTEVTYSYKSDLGKRYEQNNIYIFFSKFPKIIIQWMILGID